MFKKTWLLLMLSWCLGSVITAQTVNILITAENDTTETIRDKSVGDGEQGIIVHGDVAVDNNDADARFGNQSLVFTRGNVHAKLEIDGTAGTSLGSEFTVAAFVKITDIAGSFRMFTNYPGGGGVGSNVLLFDCYGAGPTKTFRFFTGGLNNNTSVQLEENKYFHFAATYNHGTTRLYLNGTPVGSEKSGGVDLPDLRSNIFFGEDTGGGINEQLVGNADDLLLVSRVLTPKQIKNIAQGGGFKAFDAKIDIQMNPSDPAAYDLVSPGIGSFGEMTGNSLNLKAISSCIGADRYTFTNWQGNVLDVNAAETTFVVDANEVIIANYDKSPGDCELATLTLNVTPDDPNITSIVSPSPGIYEYPVEWGQVIDLSAPSAIYNCPQAFLFDHWDGPVADPGAAQTNILMDADKTVTAVYVLSQCGIMVEHVDDNDPWEEGFTDRTEVLNQNVYADLINGQPCWHIQETSSAFASYGKNLPNSFWTSPEGWTASVSMILLAQGASPWDTNFIVTGNGKQYAVQLREHQLIEPYSGTTFTFDTTDKFHTYRMVGDSTGTIRYFVDGYQWLSSNAGGNVANLSRFLFGDGTGGGTPSDSAWSLARIEAGQPDVLEVNISTNQDQDILAPAIFPGIGSNYYISGTDATFAAQEHFVDINNMQQYDFDHWVVDGINYDTPEVVITIDKAQSVEAVYNKTDATTYEYTIVITGAGDTPDPNLVSPAMGTYSVVKYYNDTISLQAIPALINCPDINEFVQWDIGQTTTETAYETEITIDRDMTITAQYHTRPIEGRCGTVDVPLINGDFQDPRLPDKNSASGAGNIPGWTSDFGRFNWIDYRQQYFSSSYDSQVVLVGSNGAQISQILSTKVSPLTEYSVSLDLISSDTTLNWTFAEWEVRLETVDGELIAMMNQDTTGQPPIDENGLSDGQPHHVTMSGTVGDDRDSRVGKQFRIVIYCPASEYLVTMDNVTIQATGELFDVTLDAQPASARNFISPKPGTYTFIKGSELSLSAARGVLDCPDFLTFTEWLNGVVVSDDPQTTLIVDADKTVIADYTVTGSCQVDMDLQIYNPDFDLPAYDEGAQNVVPWGVVIGGWTPALHSSTGLFGISNDLSGFKNASPNSGGQYAVMVSTDWEEDGHKSNEMYQVLDTTFSAGQTYTVTADLGMKSDPNGNTLPEWDFTDYYVRLVGDKTGIVVAEANPNNQDPAFPDPNIYANWVTVSTSGTAPVEVAGDKIKVTIGGYDKYGMAVDSIRVTGASVPMTLTLQADPAGAGAENTLTPTAGQTIYPFPAKVHIGAAPEVVSCPDRLMFSGWYGDVADPDQGQTTVTMDQDQTVIARYTVNTDFYNSCGDICHPYPEADINQDCVVNLVDFAIISSDWQASYNLDDLAILAENWLQDTRP